MPDTKTEERARSEGKQASSISDLSGGPADSHNSAGWPGSLVGPKTLAESEPWAKMDTEQIINGYTVRVCCLPTDDSSRSAWNDAVSGVCQSADFQRIQAAAAEGPDHLYASVLDRSDFGGCIKAFAQALDKAPPDQSRLDTFGLAIPVFTSCQAGDIDLKTPGIADWIRTTIQNGTNPLRIVSQGGTDILASPPGGRVMECTLEAEGNLVETIWQENVYTRLGAFSYPVRATDLGEETEE